MKDRSGFGKRLKEYRESLGIRQIDMAKILEMDRSKIIRIELGTMVLNLNEVMEIAKKLGMEFYVMLNPKKAMPKYNQLPERTRKLIDEIRIEHKVKNITLRNTELNLWSHIKAVLISVKSGEPKTSREIYEQFSEEIKQSIVPERITGLLGVEPQSLEVDTFPEVRGKAKRFALKGKWSEEQDVVLRAQLKVEIAKEKEIAKAKEKTEKQAAENKEE